MAFCVTFVFTVTLSVFPAVTADVKTVFSEKWGRMSERYSNVQMSPRLFFLSETNGRHLLSPVSAPPHPPDRFFISVCCFLTFNIFDWFGRTVTTIISWVGVRSSV